MSASEVVSTPVDPKTTESTESSTDAPVRKTKSGGGGRCLEKASVMALIKAINAKREAEFLRSQWPKKVTEHVETFAKDEKNAGIEGDARQKALDEFIEEKRTKELEAIQFRLSSQVHVALEGWIASHIEELEKINYFAVSSSYPAIKLKKVYFHKPYKNYRKPRVTKIKDNVERVCRYAILSAAQLTSSYGKITIGSKEINLALTIMSSLVFQQDAPVTPVVPEEESQGIIEPKKTIVKKPKIPAKKAKVIKTTHVASPIKKTKPPKTATPVKKLKRTATDAEAAVKSKEPAAKKQKTSALPKKTKAVNVVSA